MVQHFLCFLVHVRGQSHSLTHFSMLQVNPQADTKLPILFCVPNSQEKDSHGGSIHFTVGWIVLENMAAWITHPFGQGVNGILAVR